MQLVGYLPRAYSRPKGRDPRARFRDAIRHLEAPSSISDHLRILRPSSSILWENRGTKGGPSDAENRQLFRSVRAEHQDPLDIACSARTRDE